MHASAHSSQVGASSESLSRDYPAVALERDAASGPLLLLCEHASPHVPVCYAGLGLDSSERERHIGWDIGALAMARELSEALDSPLIYATQSRLLMDLNRDPSAVDAIPASSDGTTIPANQNLSGAELQRRRLWLYEPFHAAVDALRARRWMRYAPGAWHRVWRQPWCRSIRSLRKWRVSNAHGTSVCCPTRIVVLPIRCSPCCAHARMCAWGITNRMRRIRVCITASGVMGCNTACPT